MTAALFADEGEIARLLRAHQLNPVCLKVGGTVWRCRTCNLDWSGSIPHAHAQSEHQAWALDEQLRLVK